MNPRFRPFLSVVLILLVLITACQAANTPTSISQPNSPSWKYADLHLLALPHPGSAGPDWIAGYTQVANQSVRIRGDLLTTQAARDFDLYLALDTQPGGTHQYPIAAQSSVAWDVWVSIPVNGPPTALDARFKKIPGLIPRFTWDPDQGTVEISLDQAHLPGDMVHFQVTIYLTRPHSRVVISQIGPFRSDAPLPPRAPVLLAFWNSFSAQTPAQALRRWNGAHTGPLGQRHGLQPLLEAASQYDIPLALLDLKTPQSLSGLEYMDGMPIVKELLRRRLLILPDSSYGDPASASTSLNFSRQAAKAAGLAESQFFFGAFDDAIPRRYTVLFAELSDPSHAIRKDGRTILPLPSQVYPESSNASKTAASDPQADMDGLSLTIRKKILQTALSSDPTDLVVLGGSLPNLAWGDSLVSGKAMAYLANHPWIQMLTGEDLVGFPSQHENSGNHALCPELICLPDLAPIQLYTIDRQPIPSGLNSHQVTDLVRKNLIESVPGPLTDLAWQTYLQLTTPNTNPALTTLQSTYVGQVNDLLYASQWSQHPQVQSDCTADLDLDGLPECILASSHQLAIIKPQGGLLSFAFSLTRSGVVQWLAPFSEQAVGLSDPSQWRSDRGPATDPRHLPGGFSDPGEIWPTYQASPRPGSLSLVDTQTGNRKSFQLLQDGLRVEIHTSQPQQVRVPFALSDGQVSPDWAGSFTSKSIGSHQATWGWISGPQIEISTNQAVVIHSFLQSYQATRRMEDPNLEYPPGHYLPFPFAILEAGPATQFQFDFHIRP